MSDERTIWAFDLGKASIGEAVRRGNEFLHKAALLIPGEFAETKSAAARRRMWRTRQAHRARERWLEEVWKSLGLELLYGRNRDKVTGTWKTGEPGDERLEREFSSSGDETCYTSCLLRIKLLRGENLEAWQIFKALRSAIQRRGYDPDIPWKTRAKERNQELEEDEGATLGRMQNFEGQLATMASGRREYLWPCYFDAWKMGLWDPSRPEELKPRQDCQAQSTRDQVVPRKLVEGEIRALVEAAAKQIPALSGKADYLLYGPPQRRYASFYREERQRHGLREGGATDWCGVMGQKIPRFDNRIIGKCVLIPRLNVCKIRTGVDGELHPKSRIAAEAVFLMKLKNMRLQEDARVRPLTAEEVCEIFNDPKRKKLALTATQWKKWCLKFGGQPLPGQYEEVAEPRFSGRSRFSRPALEILKRLILSGDSPAQAYEKELTRLNGNSDPLKGLVKDDLKFFFQMGPTWEDIYIPNQKLDALARSGEDAEKSIQQLIGSQNDPIVRHRLALFVRRLNELAERFGPPDFVVLEFVREDFMGKKAKLEYLKFQRERASQRAKAREEAALAGAHERSAGLKMELLKAQVGECVYCPEDKLVPEKLEEYVIDHIVPRSKRGPDAAVNYVLTTRRTNDDKGERTPYEWLAGKEGWSAYVERMKKRVGTLRNKKVQLLTSPDAETLVQKYTALAETAWISKLAQTIVGLRFNWPGGIAEGRRKVVVVSGGLTGRIRRKYKLNSLLNPNAKSEAEAELKNRGDDRHHALDAMVISYIPNWARDERLTGFFRFPEGVHRELFGKEIAAVIPQFVCFEKAALAETIYSKERQKEGLITQRVPVRNLAFKPAPTKPKFDLEYARKQINSVRDVHVKKLLGQFLETCPSEAQWDEFCSNVRLTGKNGGAGSRIRKIKVNIGKPDEFADLSKDGRGAWRKAKQGHKGQIVYINREGRPKIRPVYAFESVNQVRQELKAGGGEVYGFFRSGCLVSIDKPIAHPSTPLKAGVYRLNTIKAIGRAKVTSASGEESLPISIAKFIEANLKPLHALGAATALRERRTAMQNSR